MDETININGIEYRKATSGATKLESKSSKVMNLLGTEFMEALQEADAFIAGGAILSTLTDTVVNDVDVYFRDKESMAKAFATVTQNFSNIYYSHTDKSITLGDSDSGLVVQFIHFDYFQTAEDIFKAFDFTVCMGAVRVKTGELFLHDDLMSDVASRTLHFNNGTRFPYISLVRVKKYEEKGYKIGKGHLLAIANACAAMPITSWEQAKVQLGGIYGYEITVKLENDEEFSPEAFNKVLTNLEERDWKEKPSGDYNSLCDELGIKSDREF